MSQPLLCYCNALLASLSGSDRDKLVIFLWGRFSQRHPIVELSIRLSSCLSGHTFNTLSPSWCLLVFYLLFVFSGPFCIHVCLCSGRLQSPFLSKQVYESERASSPQRQASPVPAGSASPVRATGVSLLKHKHTHTHEYTKNPYAVCRVPISYLIKSSMLNFSMLFYVCHHFHKPYNHEFHHESFHSFVLSLFWDISRLPFYLFFLIIGVKHAKNVLYVLWLVVVFNLHGLVNVFLCVHACLCLCFGW